MTKKPKKKPAAQKMPIKYRTKWKYKLKCKYLHCLPVTLCGPGGTLKNSKGQPLITVTTCDKLNKYPTIRFGVGYSWDGPSGPTFDTRNGMRASLVHDGLYQALRLKWLSPQARKAADVEFLRILKEDGMTWWRRGLWYLGVRCFGKWSARPPNGSPPSRLKKLAIAVLPPALFGVLLTPRLIDLIDWLMQCLGIGHGIINSLIEHLCLCI